MTLHLTLVRHASTRGTATRRYEGSLDPPLSPAGEDEARALAAELRDRSFDAVWSSDLRRAARTAALVFPDRDVALDARLRELDMGGFEGRTHAANLAHWGEEYRRWIDEPARFSPPGGESLDSLRTRIGRWLAKLPDEGRVAAVCHGGTVRVAVAITEGLPFTEVRGLDVPPCGVVETRWNGASP